MQQSGGVDEFDEGRGLDMRAASRATGTAREHHQQRPQAFAAAGYDVLGHLVDQRHNALKTRPNRVVDGLKIGPHEVSNGLQCGH